jgi:hypothetical protein
MRMKESWHAQKAGKWKSYWKDEVHDPSAPYILTKCVEFSADVRKELELDVVEEESIKIMLDGRHLVTLPALPRELRELAAGFLICTREETFQTVPLSRQEGFQAGWWQKWRVQGFRSL